MTRAVNLSLSLRTKQYFVAAVLVAFFLVPLFGAVFAALGLPTGRALVAAAVAGAAVTVLWVRKLGDDDASTWDAIPEWQYNGRFAEAGGLTRSGQEAALDELSDEV